MKSIQEIAYSLGVTRQTIYNVINDTEGLSIDELTTKKAGKQRLFDEEAVKKIEKALSERKVVKWTIDNRIDKLKAAEKTVKELTDKTKEQAEEIEKLRAEINDLKENNSYLLKTNATQAVTIQTQAVTIQKAQEREQMKLADGASEQGRGGFKGLWLRLTGKK